MKSYRYWFGACIVVLVIALLGVSCSDDSGTSPEPIPMLPTITMFNLVIGEGTNSLHRVWINQATTDTVSFDYYTADFSATADVDYQPISGSGRILPGQTETRLLVSSFEDTLTEGDETFALVIRHITNATPGDTVCHTTIIDEDTVVVSFSRQVRPLLTRTESGCLGGAAGNCHTGPSPAGSMSLGEEASYEDVMDARGPLTQALYGSGKIVVPYDTNSMLYQITTIEPPADISRMPLGLKALEVEEQLLIREWIRKGAPDN